MKRAAASAKTQKERRKSRWIPGGLPKRRPAKAHTDRFNKLMDELAAQAVGLPRDFAANHDHYLHGLPKKKS
jgi:hypothetical protein